ncbi:MAG TPA: fructose PTS transporter subunit IIA [Erysipelotrichaceae bacterium]|nr:fructose PTS transporter subunit IIA [Erysipelotrichaceae bacterium]
MLLNEDSIILGCELKGKDEIIRYLANVALSINRIVETEPYIQAVLHRESEFSTGVGYGVAIPHGKSNVVKEAFVLFCKVNDVDWNSLDGTSVNMVFMIGVPEQDNSNEHLKILALLSRKLMKEEFRLALTNSKTKEEVLSVFKQYELN